MTRSIITSSLFAISLALTAASAIADPYCNRCPNNCESLGLGRKDCSEIASARGLCCVDLTQKGLRIANELDRAQGSNDARSNEHCPSGFSPSEKKCSNEERRRGCKDMRLPGGLGCVRR